MKRQFHQVVSESHAEYHYAEEHCCRREHCDNVTHVRLTFPAPSIVLMKPSMTASDRYQIDKSPDCPIGLIFIAAAIP
jgi:hypothetical protein